MSEERIKKLRNLAYEERMKKENWKVINMNKNYAVSNLGRVKRIVKGKSSRVGRILKPLINKKTGYFSVALSHKSAVKRVDIHRLVAIEFIGNPPTDQHLVAHNDGIRTNNSVDNLRWATQSENLSDMRKHGTALAGSRNPMAKLDDFDRALVHKLNGMGIPKTFIADWVGVHKRTVYKLLSSNC